MIMETELNDNLYKALAEVIEERSTLVAASYVAGSFPEYSGKCSTELCPLGIRNL